MRLQCLKSLTAKPVPYTAAFERRLTWLLTALIWLGAVSTAGAAEPSARQLIEAAVARFETVQDYTCRLDKRVRKEKTLHEDLDISVKYMKPKHYYFHWNRGAAKGREVIFVEGRNEDRIIAHSGGMFRFVTLQLDPEGRLAMRANRHSLKSSGMEKIIALMASNMALADAKGLDGIHRMGEELFDGRSLWLVEGHFPEDQGFYAHRIRLAFCPVTRLPLNVSIYDWSGQLVEAYAFHDLHINVGLSEQDFDPGNPEYSYSGR